MKICQLSGRLLRSRQNLLLSRPDSQYTTHVYLFIIWEYLFLTHAADIKLPFAYLGTTVTEITLLNEIVITCPIFFDKSKRRKKIKIFVFSRKCLYYNACLSIDLHDIRRTDKAYSWIKILNHFNPTA